MDIMNYIVQQGLVLIPALLILGQIVKNIPKIPNWTIPIILLAPGVGGTIAILGWTAQAVIQGILITGAAVYGNQIWKQIVYSQNDSDEPSGTSGSTDAGGAANTTSANETTDKAE